MGLKRIFSLGILLIFLLLAGIGWCEDSSVIDSEQPLQITSSSLESDGQLGQVVFRGDVIAVQGGLILKADKLVIYHQGKDNHVSRVEAIGDVRIEKDGRIATGDRGVYEVGEETIIMTGSPRVQQGENFVEGDEIAFFLNADRSIVKSKSGSRVKAILTPKGDTVGP